MKKKYFWRIAFIKTGWAEHYDGDEVVGRHKYVDDSGDAYEKFNFKRVSGRFFGYLPPIGKQRGRKYTLPNPDCHEDWLVIFCAALEGKGPLVPVGWYEKATFLSTRIPRPEYRHSRNFPVDPKGVKYVYSITALKGKLISGDKRKNIVIPGDHFKRTPIIYARGHRDKKSWREEYAKIAEDIVCEHSYLRLDDLINRRCKQSFSSGQRGSLKMTKNSSLSQPRKKQHNISRSQRDIPHKTIPLKRPPLAKN